MLRLRISGCKLFVFTRDNLYNLICETKPGKLDLLPFFRIFSIVLGICVMVSLLSKKHSQDRFMEMLLFFNVIWNQ